MSEWVSCGVLKTVQPLKAAPGMSAAALLAGCLMRILENLQHELYQTYFSSYLIYTLYIINPKSYIYIYILYTMY